MKEFKFKIWDPENERFVEHRNRDREIKKCFAFTTRDKVFLHQAKFKFLQYTGVKDRDGKEIYEFDIVEHTYMVHTGNNNVIEDTETIVIESISNLPFDTASIGALVIGNALEHPHLLDEHELERFNHWRQMNEQNYSN